MKTKLKTYLVRFNHVCYSSGEMLITASSMKEANEIANQIDSGDVDLNPVSGELHVEFIKKIIKAEKKT